MKVAVQRERMSNDSLAPLFQKARTSQSTRLQVPYFTRAKALMKTTKQRHKIKIGNKSKAERKANPMSHHRLSPILEARSRTVVP